MSTTYTCDHCHREINLAKDANAVTVSATRGVHSINYTPNSLQTSHTVTGKRVMVDLCNRCLEKLIERAGKQDEVRAA